jgi:hypothetical protein
MGERRQSLRKKSFLRGCVYFNKGRNAMDCLIRDLSDSGARIIFSGTVAVPDVLELYVPQKEQTLRARVQWRRGDEIGLVFPGAGTAAAEAAPKSNLAERVAHLETEIAALRRMVKRLKSEVESVSDADAA